MRIASSIALGLRILSLSFLSGAVLADSEVDLLTINRIVDEGFNRSELPQTAAYLTDRIGARITNSPQMRLAERWTQERLRQWGLRNVRAEGFDFGRGWSIENSMVRMVTPRVRAMRSIPVAWTPATNGAVRGPIIVAPMEREKDFEKWRGKLRGKIVLVSFPGVGSEPSEAPFKRFDDEQLRALNEFRPPVYPEADHASWMKSATFDRKRAAFLAEQGAIAWLRKSYRDGGLLSGEGYSFRIGETPSLPGIELAAEDYRQLARLAKDAEAPTIEIVSDVTFHDEDPQAYNILAEIPGHDTSAGYVMAGAHLDSWAAADGAQDNAAGCAMVMEAARILATLDIKPKRTIRFALWSGEEPGLLGSTAYIERHLATRAPLSNPTKAGLNPYFSRSWLERWPITPTREHGQLSAYFNLDNGSGKVRGIYVEGNHAVVPIFKQWLQPFASMGATTVAIQRTGGTDHEFMQAVGIPAFQFIQDPLDYSSRILHSSIDSYDHLKMPDLKQAAVILAAFLVNAANRAEPLPRMPLPTQPISSDPFTYDQDDEG